MRVEGAVEAGQLEVLADERTRHVKASLSRDHELIYPPIQAAWDRRDDGETRDHRRYRDLAHPGGSQ